MTSAQTSMWRILKFFYIALTFICLLALSGMGFFFLTFDTFHPFIFGPIYLSLAFLGWKEVIGLLDIK